MCIRDSYNGNLLHTFGGEGRGPGEFERISGFWVFEDEYLIYDYNNFKFLTYNSSGEIVNERVLEKNPFNPASMYAIPTTLHALSTERIAVQVLGRKGALFAVADLTTNDVAYFGEAIVEPISMGDHEMDRAYGNGEIPHNYKNFVMIAGDDSYIYCFQQTTGVLQKFDLKGELIWSTEIVVPSQQLLFEQISKYNIEMEDRPFVKQDFFKARDIKITEEGVAILLNMPDDHPLTIVWISNDGEMKKLLSVEGVQNDRYGMKESFTISPDEKYAYYLKRTTGIVYRFQWSF